ncbi:MAG: hypothetical protein ACHQDD_06535 [Steroidobacterales bacterium]
MAELVFVLSDFFSAAPHEAGAGLPRLPLLESILARAHVTPLATDWRGWLAARGPGGAERASTPAATVAAAWDALPPPVPAPRQVWLATPVHYFAGLDSVHLHPAGLLRLDREEQDRLAADFARVFADSPWVLRGLGQRELLLSGPAIAASGADPALFAGSDPSGGLPRGAGAATLRTLGAEMEMWLYEHPLNLERRSRGELPVTTFWLWGAEGMPTAPMHSPGVPAHLYGRDTYAEALWRLQGDAAQELPAAFDAALIDPRADSVFLYSLLQPDGLTSALLQFEQRWLPGGLRALRQRRVSGLWLLLGARAYRLRWLDLARFWRARAAWWERLA